MILIYETLPIDKGRVDKTVDLDCCGVSSNNKACYASTQSALQPEIGRAHV